MNATQAAVNHERVVQVKNGWAMLVLLVALYAAGVAAAVAFDPPARVVAIVSVGLLCVMWPGFFTLQPNEARVLVLFGAYKGTVRTSGFHWGNPFYSSGVKPDLKVMLGRRSRATAARRDR